MNPTRIIRRLAIALAGLAAPVVAFVAAGPAAFATNVPPPGVGPQERLGPPPVYHAAAGMPGWQIALITIGAALAAIVLAVLYGRTRAARQPVTSPSTTKAAEHSMSGR
jgi:hypothetical protein